MSPSRAMWFQTSVRSSNTVVVSEEVMMTECVLVKCVISNVKVETTKTKTILYTRGLQDNRQELIQ